MRAPGASVGGGQAHVGAGRAAAGPQGSPSGPGGAPPEHDTGPASVGRRRCRGHTRKARRRRRGRACGRARPRGGDQPTEGARPLKLSSRAEGPWGPLPAACWRPPTPPPRPVQPRGGPQARVFTASEDTMRSMTRGAAPSAPQGPGSQRAQPHPLGREQTHWLSPQTAPSSLTPAPHPRHRRAPEESESF